MGQHLAADPVAPTPEKTAESGLLRRHTDVEGEEIAASGEITPQVEVMALPGLLPVLAQVLHRQRGIVIGPAHPLQVRTGVLALGWFMRESTKRLTSRVL